MNAEGLINSSFKLGILGGGQLGKMLALAAGNWHLPIHILDKSKDFPAGTACSHFTEGDFKDFDAVYNFGKTVDLLTIEIEHVNTDALLKLEEEGLTIYPKPSILNTIKDKGLQKQFYEKNGLPTSEFQLFEDENALKTALQEGAIHYPFVQKSRTAGYDGKGVAIIHSVADFAKILPGPSLIEPLVDIDKELAVIVAQNPSGEIAVFSTVEMEFNPEANLVEYLRCPANISEGTAKAAEQLAVDTIKAYGLCGLLAVEFFLTKDGDILINEVAPRPHNSGHHTIDSCITSQFQQHLRAILDLPLGSTSMHSPSVMVNLLGAAGYTGQAIYQGLEDCLRIEGAKMHLYGKRLTKPFRKMGHATVVDPNIEKAIARAKELKEKLQIIA